MSSAHTVTYRKPRPPAQEHPAPYNPKVLAVMASFLEPGMRVLDPMAGVGRIHLLRGVETWGVELEPEWAGQHQRTLVGDCRRLPFPSESFDAIAVSPVYGNRMSDHHDARDASKRHTYRHCLGRPLSAGNSGQLQWGDLYREFHADHAWPEAVRVLRPGGFFLLNVSDHIRQDKREHVAIWHRDTLVALGLEELRWKPVGTQRQRHGANGRQRVDSEEVIVLGKPYDEWLQEELTPARPLANVVVKGGVL